MALYLVNPGVEMTLELFVSDKIEDAVAIQFERISDSKVRDIFVRRLENRLSGLLGDCLDWDIKAPTPAQITYATVVAAQQGVPLPSEAKKYRFHMAMFLEAYAPKSKEATAKPGTPSGVDLGADTARRLVASREGQEDSSVCANCDRKKVGQDPNE